MLDQGGSTKIVLEMENGSSRMLLRDFQVNDYEVVEYFSQIPEDQRSGRLATAINVGVTGLKAMGTTERIDYIAKHFSTFEQVIDRKIVEYFGVDGVLERLIGTYFGDNGELKTLLDKNLGEDGQLVKKVFDPNIKGTPMSRLRDEIVDLFSKLRIDLKLEERQEELLKRGTEKGFKFEEAIEEMLNEIAKPFGDIPTRTSDSVGNIQGSKKGDFVVSLGESNDVRIVVEAKDRGTMSLPQIQREMKDAVENRGCCYGILVARNVHMLPGYVGWFREYGDVLVIGLSEDDEAGLEQELLSIGYGWARTKAMTKKLELAGKIDAKAIRSLLQESKQSIERLTIIKGHCSSITAVIDDVYASIKEKIGQMTSMLMQSD